MTENEGLRSHLDGDRACLRHVDALPTKGLKANLLLSQRSHVLKKHDKAER